MDTVSSDAFQGDPLSAKGTQAFWPAWFAGFPEMDFEVTRTIAAERVVVVQWTFTGIHAGPLVPPVFERRIEPTGRAVRFRGVSIYDVNDGLIERETMYIDLATIMVELGVGV
jgi:predicted ester cyclase